MASALETGLCRLFALGLAAHCVACGDSGGGAAAPTPTPPAFPTVRLTPAGPDPREIVIRVGERITFINNDVNSHHIAGGPDPAHPDCREIDNVGFLVPGQSRQTLDLPAARTCEYHDHVTPTWVGRVVIR
jgi:hypothetical protein